MNTLTLQTSTKNQKGTSLGERVRVTRRDNSKKDAAERAMRAAERQADLLIKQADAKERTIDAIEEVRLKGNDNPLLAEYFSDLCNAWEDPCSLIPWGFQRGIRMQISWLLAQISKYTSGKQDHIPSLQDIKEAKIVVMEGLDAYFYDRDAVRANAVSGMDIATGLFEKSEEAMLEDIAQQVGRERNLHRSLTNSDELMKRGFSERELRGLSSNNFRWMSECCNECLRLITVWEFLKETFKIDTPVSFEHMAERQCERIRLDLIAKDQGFSNHGHMLSQQRAKNKEARDAKEKAKHREVVNKLGSLDDL